MRKLAILGLALALVSGMAAVAAAAPVFTIYTSISDWVAACPDNLLQDFDEAFPGGLNPGVSVSSTNGFVDTTLQVWSDVVEPSGAASTNWSFNPMIFGAGAYFDLNPAGPGTGLAIFADGDFVGNIANTYTGQFWGFLSDTPFTNLLFAADGYSGVRETYYMDDLRYCPVPVPPAVWLLGSGLLGLAGLRRKLKA